MRVTFLLITLAGKARFIYILYAFCILTAEIIGNQPINIFPQDLSVNRGSYAQFEGKIYDCIHTYGATAAALAWTFTYETTLKTKPYKVLYTAKFTGGTCANLSQTFTN